MSCAWCAISSSVYSWTIDGAFGHLQCVGIKKHICWYLHSTHTNICRCTKPKPPSSPSMGFALYFIFHEYTQLYMSMAWYSMSQFPVSFSSLSFWYSISLFSPFGFPLCLLFFLSLQFRCMCLLLLPLLFFVPFAYVSGHEIAWRCGELGPGTSHQ